MHKPLGKQEMIVGGESVRNLGDGAFSDSDARA